MNGISLVVLFLLILVIFTGSQVPFTRPQYLKNLSAVYSGGSCGTYHVITSGNRQRNSNGTFGSYNGTYVPRYPNRIFTTHSSNRTFRQRNSSRMFPLNLYGTLFQNKSDHAAYPSTTLRAIWPPSAATPVNTGVASAGIQAASWFKSVAALGGLFACVLLCKAATQEIF